MTQIKLFNIKNKKSHNLFSCNSTLRTNLKFTTSTILLMLSKNAVIILLTPITTTTTIFHRLNFKTTTTFTLTHFPLLNNSRFTILLILTIINPSNLLYRTLLTKVCLIFHHSHQFNLLKPISNILANTFLRRTIKTRSFLNFLKKNTCTRTCLKKWCPILPIKATTINFNVYSVSNSL